MNFANGAIMTSLMPDFVKTVLMATMIEMINIVGINSVIAKVKLLNIPLIDDAKLPVATKAKRKIPIMQMRVVSRRLTINPIINTNKYNINPIECR